MGLDVIAWFLGFGAEITCWIGWLTLVVCALAARVVLFLMLLIGWVVFVFSCLGLMWWWQNAA